MRPLFSLEGRLDGLPLRVSVDGDARRARQAGRAVRTFGFLTKRIRRPLPNSSYLYLGEWPRLAFTARIGRAQFHRARSASKKGTWPLLPIHSSLLVISQVWGLIDLLLRASFSPTHSLADIFHPPYPPIASQSISRDMPLTRTRVFRDRALHEHRKPSSLPSPISLRTAWSILDCARRTSTFLSCAFREQEDGQASRLPS